MSAWIENIYKKNQYALTYAYVARDFAERDSDGNWNTAKRYKKYIRIHASLASAKETNLCPECGHGVFVHNQGKLVPHHFEHKTKSEAINRKCRALLDSTYICHPEPKSLDLNKLKTV